MDNYYEQQECPTVVMDDQLQEVFENAAQIATALGDSTIRSVYLIWSMLKTESVLHLHLIRDMGIIVPFEYIPESIAENNKFLPSILGEDVASEISSNLMFNVNIKHLKALVALFEEEEKNDNDDSKTSTNIIDTLKELINSNEDANSETSGDSYIAFPLTNTLSELMYHMVEYSDNVELCLEESQMRLKDENEGVIDIFTFTYTLLSLKDTSARKFLDTLNISSDALAEIFKHEYNICDYDDNITNTIHLPANISEFCEILNNRYSEDCVCDIIGRDSEIERFWITASRKSKRNCILTGPGGVGKSAIAEAITMSIVNGSCPKQFKDYLVIEVNITSITADTTYRGQFESKVKALIKYVMDNPKVILFIDEIHHILGAGMTQSSNIDLAGMLKPILARDHTIVLGATTTEEYERVFSTDGAFKRRFEIIEVKEPKIKDIKSMISKRIENLSTFHNVSVSDEIIDYIIIQAFCFYPQTANPDKTISLLDSSMAVAKSKGRHTLTKKHVDMVNSDKLKKFKLLSYSDRLATAYHEAGHYVSSRVLKSMKYEVPIVVSIISFDYYDGIYAFECDETIAISGSITFYTEKMISLMAGRASEKFFTGCINSGASNDLAKVTNIAREMFLQFGMASSEDDPFFNLSLMNESGRDSTFLSENIKDQVNQKVKSIVDKVYVETLKLVEENKDTIERIAKALAKNGMLTASELDKLFKNEPSNITETKA